jgi:hypothetical protein
MGKPRKRPEKDILTTLYIVQELSTWQIAKVLSASQTAVRKWLEYYSIPVRSISEAKSGPKNHNYGKYGPLHHNYNKRGPLSTSWRGGRVKDKDGYIYVYCPDHPAANAHGYIFEHRLVAEEMLGRLLDDNEVVHHKNDVRNDNRPENLEVMSRAEHMALHLRGYERAEVS